MLKILSYVFYSIAIAISFFASFEILAQTFPEYGVFHILVGFIGTAMFFLIKGSPPVILIFFNPTFFNIDEILIISS